MKNSKEMKNKTDINFIKIKSSAVHVIYIGKIGKTLTTDLNKNCSIIILGERGKKVVNTVT